MRLVGLTGGIASGKSTVSNLFKASGLPVVDADIVARNVVKKGSGGWKKVVKAFGNDVLLEDGEIDRARLGQIVFSDPAKRQVLNRLLAPHISSGILWEILKLWIKGCKVIILDIPLLFETKMNGHIQLLLYGWMHKLKLRDSSQEMGAQKNKLGIGSMRNLHWTGRNQKLT